MVLYTLGATEPTRLSSESCLYVALLVTLSFYVID